MTDVNASAARPPTLFLRKRTRGLRHLPEAATLAGRANARTSAIVYLGVTEPARDAMAARLVAGGFGKRGAFASLSARGLGGVSSVGRYALGPSPCATIHVAGRA